MNNEDTKQRREMKRTVHVAAEAVTAEKAVPKVLQEKEIISRRSNSRPKWQPGFFSLLGGALFRPVDTFEQIREEPPVAYGLLSFTLIMVFAVLFSLVIGLRLLTDLALPAEIYGLLPLMYLAITAFFYFVLIADAAILHLLAEFLGGKGPAKGILMVCCYAVWPVLLLAVLGMLILLLSLSNFTGQIIMGVGVLLVVIWFLVILWSGIVSIYDLSWFRAALVFIIPAVAFVLFILLLLLTVVEVMALFP